LLKCIVALKSSNPFLKNGGDDPSSFYCIIAPRDERYSSETWEVIPYACGFEFGDVL